VFVETPLERIVERKPVEDDIDEQAETDEADQDMQLRLHTDRSRES